MAPSSGGAAGEEPGDDPPRRYPATQPGSAEPSGHMQPQAGAASPYLPTEMDPPARAPSPYLPTETGRHSHGVPAPGKGWSWPTASAAGPAGIVRQGPGVPVSSPADRSGPPAEQIWRTGQSPAPPRRRRSSRRIAGSALTVVLLAAAAVVLFPRFHHGPLKVTGVAITRKVTNGCAVDVTGRIATNGSAGTVSYQWLFTPQSQAPQPLSQSMVAGQGAAYVTVTVQGQGQGSAAQTVTLQVLGPGTGTASTRVAVSC